MENTIILSINKLFKNQSNSIEFKLKNNTGSEKSIVYSTKLSPYYGKEKEILFFNYKLIGARKYVKFSSRYASLFSDINVENYKIDSQPAFIRIELHDFLIFLNNDIVAYPILSTIFSDSFSSDSFGCCHLYVECSNCKKCIHPDLVYSRACQYRSNLESNRIFYGVNKNI